MKQTVSRNNAEPRKEANQEPFSFGTATLYANKEEYASKVLPFDILAIDFEPDRGFEGGDRWAISVKAADRPCEVLTLGSNPKRDEQLREAKARVEAGSIIRNVVLRVSGGTYYFADGSPAK